MEQAVIEAPENRLSEFIAERTRSRTNPLSISIQEKTFFREFILSPPTTVEFEGPEDFSSPVPRCGGRLRVIAAVQDPLAVQAILCLSRPVRRAEGGPQLDPQLRTSY